MSEPSKIKGAVELKKICQLLFGFSDSSFLDKTSDYKSEISKKLSSPITIEKSGNILKVAKRTNSDLGSEVEFEFTFRLLVFEDKIEWWPIQFTDISGRKLDAEIKIGDRVLTNIHKQNELIELANSWAKSISSQNLTRTIDGII